MKLITTLSIVYEKPKVLLGLKKRGFGQGRWNGFGGKVLPYEAIEQAAEREFKEETGLQHALNQCKRGVLIFFIESDFLEIEVHLFSVAEFSGTPQESDEMKPQWFCEDEIPFHQMWPSDVIWYPLFLQGKCFKGEFHYKNHTTMVKHFVEEVESV